MKGCELKNNKFKPKKKPLWLEKAETLRPNEFIEWMHKNKSYKVENLR